MIIGVEAVVAAYNTAWAGVNAYNFSALLRRGKPSDANAEELNAFIKENALMPKISVLLPAYHEANVLNESVNALCNSNYPKERFEILVLLEHGDTDTINTAALLSLKYPNVRPILVSSKQYKNKPNALNHGLYLSVGEIVGVIDAEDIVEKDLLLKVAYNISKKGYDVVQGVLDMANDTDGWKNMMQRAEYSYWFSHLLPGMEESGMPLPLGGTTNFFKANLLNSIGGWNPKNLTEDFELGIRLYNHNLSEESKREKMAEPEKGKSPIYPYINKYTASFYAQHARDYGQGDIGVTLDTLNELKLKDSNKIKSIALIKMIHAITEEESPTSWGAWMRQRVRWQQGKIQTAKEYAVNMPKTTKGKANTAMAVITPHIAVLNITGIAIGVYAFATNALSLPLSIFTYFNFASVFVYSIANGISYASIVKPEGRPNRKLKAAIVAITTPAYWVMQWVADIKALKREYIDKNGTWDKTEHMGRHFKNKVEMQK
ncbi:MAG: glycosyltransferase [Candidatus Micrarchaeaceae archaeon]